MTENINLPTKEEISIGHDKAFNTMLTEFLTNLSTRFPSNGGISKAKLFATLMNDNATCAMKRKAWGEFSEPIIGDIMAEKLQPVLDMVVTAGNPVLTSMDLGAIMNDETIDNSTKLNIWKYIQLLSVIAHQDTGVEVPKKQQPIVDTNTMSGPSVLNESTPLQQVTPVQSVQPIQQIQQPKPATPAATPDIGKVIEGFADNLPKVMESFQKIMKQNNGDNPVAQMYNQFMNPNQSQPGVMNNLAANYMEGEGTNVMADIQQQMAGMSAQDISNKLKKLERIESARSKRKDRK